MCVKPLEAQHEIHTLFNFRLHQHLIRVHWRGKIHEREACWQWSSVKLHSVELLRDIIASDHHPHIHQRLGHILQIDLCSMLLLCLQVVQNDVPPVPTCSASSSISGKLSLKSCLISRACTNTVATHTESGGNCARNLKLRRNTIKKWLDNLNERIIQQSSRVQETALSDRQKR